MNVQGGINIHLMSAADYKNLRYEWQMTDVFVRWAEDDLLF